LHVATNYFLLLFHVSDPATILVTIDIEDTSINKVFKVESLVSTFLVVSQTFFFGNIKKHFEVYNEGQYAREYEAATDLNLENIVATVSERNLYILGRLSSGVLVHYRSRFKD